MANTEFTRYNLIASLPRQEYFVPDFLDVEFINEQLQVEEPLVEPSESVLTEKLRLCIHKALGRKREFHKRVALRCQSIIRLWNIPGSRSSLGKRVLHSRSIPS